MEVEVLDVVGVWVKDEVELVIMLERVGVLRIRVMFWGR